MKLYNWQQSDWPNFQYDASPSYGKLLSISEKMGLFSGKLAHLTESQRSEAIIALMVEEAVKTSGIEGEHINRLDVRSSINNKLGLNSKVVRVHDKRAQGIAELLLDTRNTFKQPLTQTQLFGWHLMLMSGTVNPNARVGHWRISEEPMQIVSGHHNRWVVHYEAPPSQCIPSEMKKFIRWFNDTAPGKPSSIQFPAIRAAIAHLYFESIHPFDDGNGRLGRAIAEKALSQGFGYPVLISLSSAIESNKKAYYAALKAASRSNEVTNWVEYFVDLVFEAQLKVEQHVNFIIKKAQFFDGLGNTLNERQLKVVKRMMQAGPTGFEGGISAKKYMSIADTSKATATRDLQHLFSLNVLRQIGSGRNVHYELNL